MQAKAQLTSRVRKEWCWRNPSTDNQSGNCFGLDGKIAPAFTDELDHKYNPTISAVN
jgi:hypothetical protein